MAGLVDFSGALIFLGLVLLEDSPVDRLAGRSLRPQVLLGRGHVALGWFRLVRLRAIQGVLPPRGGALELGLDAAGPAEGVGIEVLCR